MKNQHHNKLRCFWNAGVTDLHQVKLGLSLMVCLGPNKLWYDCLFGSVYLDCQWNDGPHQTTRLTLPEKGESVFCYYS